MTLYYTSANKTSEHEIVRSDLVDGELGVPMHLEFEFVDSETCEPAQDLWIDVWAASTIGVYSGVNFTHDNTVITYVPSDQDASFTDNRLATTMAAEV